MKTKSDQASYASACRALLALLLGVLLSGAAVGAEPVYRALNPRAHLTGVKLTPLSPRPAELVRKADV